MTLRMKVGTLVAVVFLSLAVAMRAEPVSQLHPSNYVNDFAHVLDANTTAQMNSLCEQIYTKTHAQIAVVTINTLDVRDVESYAVDLY